MKRAYTVITCLIMSIITIVAQEQAYNTVNINLSNGNVDSFLLSEIEQIKHGVDGSISLVSAGETITYIASEIESIYFSHVDNPYNIEVTTSDASNITAASAVVECRYDRIPTGAVCGVKYTSDGENYKTLICENPVQTQQILLSGLEPFTTYTYYAYVDYAGETYRGESKSFTTTAPDISGTWTCTQQTYQSTTQSYITESYTITLKSDGSVSCSRYDSVVSSGWNYNDEGKLTISITDFATMNYIHGTEWIFTADDVKKPHLFTGSTYSWNSNSVIGYVQGDSHTCTMTR